MKLENPEYMVRGVSPISRDYNAEEQNTYMYVYVEIGSKVTKTKWKNAGGIHGEEYASCRFNSGRCRNK